jgi:3-methyladenine DNA glycosylase AlkC
MLLKDIYSPTFYNQFSDVVKKVMPSFDKKEFTQQIFDTEWNNRELKDRMRHTTKVLHHFMPNDFEKASNNIKQIIVELRKNKITESSLEFMFFPDYIESYGMQQLETSLEAIEFITQFTSCEFAIRPFIVHYENKALAKMLEWSTHENHHVRRLASEGSRSRLPWAIALPSIKKDPAPILPILENLKNDASEYVRRSVANNLNDISKDNPSVVISIAQQWKGISKETDALIKHGCRTLLKSGHSEILHYYGLDDTSTIVTEAFKINTPKVIIGEALNFSFNLINQDALPKTIRLEYGVYYLRQNGTHARKVFKISERLYQPNEEKWVEKNQSFKLITTRRFYAGIHKVSLIVNGKEVVTEEFELLE